MSVSVALVCILPGRAAAFECTAGMDSEGTYVEIADGDESVVHRIGAGDFLTGEVKCESWNAKAVRAILASNTAGSYEVFAGLDADGTLQVAWSGFTGLSGDFGERWGWFIDFEPTKPGGDKLVPILYALSEQIKLCGHGMVPLYVRMYDPKEAAFRPISFDRLRRAGVGWGHGAAPSEASGSSTSVSVAAALSEKSDPSPPVLDGFLRFRSASSTLGDESNPSLARAPLELSDSDPSTGWFEGTGGTGWGEFVTAHTAEPSIPLVSLSLHLGRGDDAKQIKKFNRVKTLEIVTGEGDRFEVKIPFDPAKHPGRPMTIRFPSPVTTKCISVILRDVYPSKASGDHTWIGEVTGYTALDSGEGVRALLEWFDDPDRAAEAAKLMRDINPAVLAEVVQQWPTLSPAARKGIIEGIHVQWADGLAPLVRIAAEHFEEDDVETKILLTDRIVEVLSDLDDPSALVTTLQQWSQAPDEHPVGGLAVIALARIGHETGLASLLAIYADGEQVTASTTPVQIAGWIREGMTRAQQPGLMAMQTTLESLDLTIDTDVHTALVLLRLLDYDNGGEPTTALASQWGFKLWDEVPSHATRHHLLPVASKLIFSGCPEGVELASLALTDPDAGWMLHMEGLMTLATAGPDLADAVVAIVVPSLSDDHPAVRGSAAQCLRRVGGSGDQVEPPSLIAAESDPWPEVRIEALKLVATFETVPIESVYDFLDDDDSSVRKVAVRMVVDRGLTTEEIGILLANTTVDPSMRADVRVEAAHAIGQLCLVSMAMPLGNVLYYGIVPGASEAQIQTAAAAADALGRLGDSGPLDKLLMATRPGLRLQIRLAAIRALGSIADPEASETLQQLTSSLDAAVAAAAREALDLVNAGHCTAECKTP